MPLTIKLLSKLPFLLCLPFAAFAAIDDGSTASDADHLLGDTNCPWGEVDCNPCVNNVEENFDNISNNNGSHTDHTMLRIEARDDSGEIMCLFTGNCELDESWHIQGMARLPNVDGNNWFVFSRSVHNDPGAIFAGQITDAASAGGHLGDFSTENDSAREITVYETLDNATPASSLNHPGGIQTLGKYVATVAYCHASESVCNSEDLMAYVYDFSDPTHVTTVTSINLSADGITNDTSAALTQLYNGRYLMIVSGDDGNPLYFYISDSDTLSTSTSWELRETWTDSELIDGGAGDTTWGTYQNLNVVTECETGDLYLIGTNRDFAKSGEDWMDLFLIEEDSSSNVVTSKIAKKHMYCDRCNFSASGNIYITPENNMVLYASEKDDEDGSTGSGDIFFEEFQNALNLCNDADDLRCDYDEDGLINFDEDAAGSSRYESDTDADGLSDYDEVTVYGTNPVSTDSDSDGLSDDEEINTYATDPNDADSDDDTLNDHDEIVTYGTNPNNSDSDSDGLADATEITYGYNPNDASDMAGDTDGDGLTNLQEISVYDTDPADADSDNDGLTDNLEIAYGMDPNDAGDNVAAVYAIIMYYLSDDDSETSETDTTTIDDDGDGYTEADGDCDDSNTALHPDQRDCGTLVIFRLFGRPVTRTVADGTDQDCDGTADEDSCSLRRYFGP